MSGKCKLEHILFENASIELSTLHSSDEEEIDEILDNLVDDLSIVPLYRYSFQSKVSKNASWFEETVKNYDEKRFRTLFRCSREQFMLILSLIENHEVFNGVNSCKQFSIYFQLALTLYQLGSTGSGGSKVKIAALFGIGDGGTINRVMERVFKSIISLEDQFITWPSEEERQVLVSETISELPHCIGYVDGSEIPLEDAPAIDPESYYSRESQYSIKLQAVCDARKRIRHYVIGWPGSVHDSRIYNNCDLAINPHEYVSGPQWIAGDSAYKLRTTVITPFRKNSRVLTRLQRRSFNRYFSSYRVRIEHCFGIAKEKFPSLKNLNVRILNDKSHEWACTWIKTCCILYNILLPHFDEQDLTYAIPVNKDDIEIAEADIEDAVQVEANEPDVSEVEEDYEMDEAEINQIDEMEDDLIEEEEEEEDQTRQLILSTAETKRLALFEVLIENQSN